MRVAFFVTCLTDAFYPRAGIAAVKVLEKLGCTVEFPAAQTCCGQPMFNNGYRAEAAALGRRMFDVFAGFDHVVTPSASCAATIVHHYPELFEHDSPLRAMAQELAGRTHEFTAFVGRVLRADLRTLGAAWEGKATFHYSCHSRTMGVPSPALAQLTVAGREPGDHHQHTLRLLRQVRGLELVDMQRSDQCCGFGGTFATKYPEPSRALVADKALCITSAGVDTVISNEAGCTMNIAGYCHRHGPEARFLSTAELLAESLGLLPRPKSDEPPKPTSTAAGVA